MMQCIPAPAVVTIPTHLSGDRSNETDHSQRHWTSASVYFAPRSHFYRYTPPTSVISMEERASILPCGLVYECSSLQDCDY